MAKGAPRVTSFNGARVPALFAEFAEVAQRVIEKRLAIPKDRAAAAGLEIAREVASEFRGELLYIPAGTALECTERDREMLKRFIACGRDIHVVAKEFQLSTQQAYRRLRIAQALEFRRVQPSLFGTDEPEV